jgi:hypothetical protein
VIAAPPLTVGAVQETADWVLALDVAATAVGAVGAPAVSELVDDEALPVPAGLVALTVNVYAWPLVRPETVQVVVVPLGVVQIWPPDDVTV